MHSLRGLYYRIEFRLEVIKLHSFSLIFKCLVWLPWVINLTSCFQLLLLHVQIVKKIIANCSIYSDLSQPWFSYVLINLWLKWQLHWFSQHWNKPEAEGDKSAQGIRRRRIRCVMHISAARQNSNCTRMRIGGVRGVYPHNIHTPASNNPRGTWCNYPCGLTNDDVTWTITIAIVPPENKHKQKNCRDDKPARVQKLIINFLGLVALER